jgi:hypothetical protein
MPTLRTPRVHPPLVITATALTAATLTGCYTHVVGVKNAPGYTGVVYEENVKEGNEELFRVRKVTPKGSTYVE